MKRSARPASAALAAAVASASSEISVAVTTASGTCEASASAMAPVPVPRSRIRQRPSRSAICAQERQHRIDQRFGVGARLQRLPATASASARRNRDSRKSCGQARRRAALPAHRRCGRPTSAPTRRSGAPMASARPVPVKCSTIMRASSAGSSISPADEPAARGGHHFGQRRRLSLRRRHRQAAATGGRRSAR